MFYQFIVWLKTSSADPAKSSLALRGVLVGFVPIVIYFLPTVCEFSHVCIDPNLVSPLVDSVIAFIKYLLTVIQALTMLASAFMMVIGILRKIYFQQWSSAPSPIQVIVNNDSALG